MRIATLAKLLGLCLVVVFSTVLGASWLSLRELKINGPLYNRVILGKDLVADILPPPAYLLEAYLETSLLAKSPDNATERIEKLAKLRKEYFERHEFWKQQDLPSALHESLLKIAHEPALLFWEQVESKFLPAIKRARELDIEESFNLLTKSYEAHRSGVDATVTIANQFNESVEAESGKKEAFYTAVILGVGASGIFLVIAVAAGILLHVVRPMTSLNNAMEALAKGSLETSIPGTHRRDELGEMSASVAVFRDASLAKQRLEAEAARERERVDRERSERELEKAEEARQAQRTIFELANGLAELAVGNLQVRITAPLSGGAEQLRNNFNTAVEKLGALLSNVVDAIAVVRSGAQEITKGSDDLSRRTEQQAASLEQTAAALDEITATGRKAAGKWVLFEPLRQLHRLLQATLDNMDQGLIVVDKNGTLPICNRRAMELLELPPAMMIASPKAEEVLALQRQRGDFDETPETAKAYIDPTGAGEVRSTYERRGKNGIILEVRTVPFADGGVVRTYTDISGRKSAEALLAKANERLESLANQDGLTGLANRRCFDDAIKRDLAQAQRSGAPLSLLLIDVDHFKRYNDHYGHVAGDECLRRIAKIVAEQCKRGCDLVARYGGEELAVLLPSTVLGGAQVLAEQVVLAVRAATIPHSTVDGGFVTISIGVACMEPHTGALPEDLIVAADRALYRAKNGGRNRADPVVDLDVRAA